MRSIIMLVALAGRRLAADGVLFTGSRYARRLLLLSATLTAAMVVGLLAYAPSARADVTCDELDGGAFCSEKTASPDPAQVGEPLTFTIRGYCTATINCGRFALAGMTDTLPEGLEFVSASATGFSGPELGNQPQPTCSESEGTVTCAPLAFWFDQEGTDVPFVATIKVIPGQCGTFTNTADVAGQLVSETFTVEGCGPTTPATKDLCKKGGWKALGWPDQGTCISAVNQNRP
jgi:uncharacterized repeat protein (TIGR01451 family)